MRFVVIAVGAAALCCVGCSSTSEREIKLQKALDQAHVSLRESVSVAEKGQPNTLAVKAALLVDSDPVFSVSAQSPEALTKIHVDIVTAKILSTEAAGGPIESCPGAVNIADAIGAAESELSGRGVAVEWDDDGHCNREVQVMSDGTLYEAKVAPNGSVIETEVSDSEEDDD